MVLCKMTGRLFSASNELKSSDESNKVHTINAHRDFQYNFFYLYIFLSVTMVHAAVLQLGLPGHTYCNPSSD